MDVDKAKQIKRAIESFFYKIKYNVGLTSILESNKYHEFRDTLETALKDQVLYFAKFEKINEIIGVNKAVRSLTDDLFLPHLDRIWIPLISLISEQILTDFFIFSADKSGQDAVNKLSSDAKFRLTNQKEIEKLQTMILLMIGQIDATTKSWIARTIEEGINNDFSIIDIARSLRDEASHIAKTRSDIIAENQAAQVSGLITNEVYLRSGVTQHRWVTAHDERTCPICMANENAGIIDIGSEFPSGALYPPSHISCRCYTLPVADNIEDIWIGT